MMLVPKHQESLDHSPVNSTPAIWRLWRALGDLKHLIRAMFKSSIQKAVHLLAAVLWSTELDKEIICNMVDAGSGNGEGGRSEQEVVVDGRVK